MPKWIYKMNVIFNKEHDDTYSIFVIVNNFLNKEEIYKYKKYLDDTNDWKGGPFFGNGMARLQKWFHDDNKYFSSHWYNQTHERWTSNSSDNFLYTLRNKVQEKTNYLFDNELSGKFYGINKPKLNSALINYYRDGNDYIRYHSDDEKIFGDNPTISMLTFGTERELKFKRINRDEQELDKSYIIKSGSLFMMMGSVQKYYRHGVEKNADVKTSRYSVTFRDHKN
jgi:alkylated DNA repair dioxygenase AlkB